jgi:hypothetical protein
LQVPFPWEATKQVFFFEVLDAIHHYNNDPATLADNRIIIDVLAGALAGGMCSIILAQPA